MNILVAASGGVAALKTPSIIRLLQEADHKVKVAATDRAYHFVSKLSLAVAAGEAVFDKEVWFRADGHVSHIELARWADLLLVAPASADALASAATGRADDVISAIILAGVPKVIWVPAMNTAMWEHPAVKNNIAVLKAWGHGFLGPVHGKLAAKIEGVGLGRMKEPDEIVKALSESAKPLDLSKHRVLISAGPTREYLDPVRFISNPSSGKMGYALAEAALARGAKVMLVSGPSALKPPENLIFERVESAVQMLAALKKHFSDASILVMSAAVADWQAKHKAEEKQAKLTETQSLDLIRTPDILTELSKERRQQIMVGFAMETDQGIDRAASKAKRKGLDFICLNYPTKRQSAFGGDKNEVTFVHPDGKSEALPLLSKRQVADRIFDRVLSLAN